MKIEEVYILIKSDRTEMSLLTKEDGIALIESGYFKHETKTQACFFGDANKISQASKRHYIYTDEITFTNISVNDVFDEHGILIN